MINKLLSTASAAALAIALSMPAQAGEIFISGTTSDALTFTAVGMNTLNFSSMSFGGNAMYVPDTGPSDTGSVLFGSMSGTAGPESGGVFPITALTPATGEPFTYQSNTGGPDELRAEIISNEVVANAGGEPQLVGTGLVLAGTTGDTAFTTDFPVGGKFSIIGNFPLSGSCDLTELATMVNCTASFEMASFEGTADFAPGGGSTAPEPMSSFMALGTALCCLWGTYQVTRREGGRSRF